MMETLASFNLFMVLPIVLRRDNEQRHFLALFQHGCDSFYWSMVKTASEKDKRRLTTATEL